MKKGTLLAMGAAIAIGFTACHNGNQGQSYTQEQLDSITKAKEDSMAAAQKAINDSLLQAKAADSARVADSLAKLQSAVKTTTTKAKAPATGPKKPATPASEAVKTIPGKKGFEPVISKTPATRTPADIEADQKAARFGDKAAQARLKADEATQKAARFGDQKAQETLKKTEDAAKADRFKKN